LRFENSLRFENLSKLMPQKNSPACDRRKKRVTTSSKDNPKSEFRTIPGFIFGFAFKKQGFKWYSLVFLCHLRKSRGTIPFFENEFYRVPED